MSDRVNIELSIPLDTHYTIGNFENDAVFLGNRFLLLVLKTKQQPNNAEKLILIRKNTQNT